MFSLHYLAVATETFVQEMTALLDSLKTFAATPGKVRATASVVGGSHWMMVAPAPPAWLTLRLPVCLLVLASDFGVAGDVGAAPSE